MQKEEKRKRIAAYEEEVLLMEEMESLNVSNHEAIQYVLNRNEAIGIVAGHYDEKLTISFVSGFFVRNLGYENEEFMRKDEDNSFLNFVCREDWHLFEGEQFQKRKDDMRFRMIKKNGAPTFVDAVKTDTIDQEGEPMWLCSIRLCHENQEQLEATLHEAYEHSKGKEGTHRNRLLQDSTTANYLVKGLIALVDRFAVCDLERNYYEFYRFDTEAPYNHEGAYTTLVRQMNERFDMLTEERTIWEALEMDRVRSLLHSEESAYRFEYCKKDKSAYKSMSVVPIEWRNGTLTKVMFIAQDITVTKKQEMETKRALEEAYEAARRASVAKTEFLSNMSHDIRTPMNAIIGMTAIAGANIDQKERVIDCLGKITNSSRHLLALINEVLDMSRIESGKATLTEEEFNLADLIDSLIAMMKPEIEGHGHELKVRILNISHEEVYGDSLCLQQVFVNIMGNAIKYTPNGGTIQFTITEKPLHHTKMACYEFVVEDNGMGMSEDFQKIIFEPFSRADNNRTTEIQGTGLGMSITKNIVNMMGGSIQVESTVGKGSRFTVVIYLKLQEQKEVCVEELYDLPVLVVDDDEICCESTVAMLEEIGMVGESVTSGEEAIKVTVKRHEMQNDFFAIIMDWKMPGMDGIETTRRIRKKIGRDVPIIVLSAYDSSEIEQEAREAGVDEFITKPLFKSRLTTVFKQLMSGKQTEQKINQLEKIATADYSAKRVLVVEDNALNREIATEIIGITGAKVETANNGQEAVDKIEKMREDYYDLVFMDIQMPIMNGYEATTAIRSMEHKNGHTLPIVAMTANAFVEDAQMAKNVGMDEHIVKPLDLKKLNEVLEKYL